ncbi:hypothetical protein JXQ70_19285 [bacterium]|nr:hypothetical protein [bacterium]
MTIYDQINADYKAILEKNDPVGQLKYIQGEMNKCRMDMHGEPFPTFAKPYFVDEADRPMISDATEKMITSLNKVGDAFFKEGKFKKQIQLESKGRTADLAYIDAGYPGHQIMNRLDVFFDTGTKSLKFLEFNCGDPSGMGWNDNMLSIFLQVPAVVELQKKYNLRPDWLVKSHEKKLLKKYRQFCERKGIKPEKKPNIAFVCWRESTIIGDFLAFVDYYKSLGYNTIFADPRDFEYDGKVASVKGLPIPLLYRDAIDDFVKDEFWPDCQPIIQAYRDQNVCFVNPVSAASGDFKSLLEILSDPQYESIFTPEEREAHHKYIPWTRTFVDIKTDFHGKQIELLEHVRKNKDTFVLKPNDGYGGFGVMIGNVSEQKDWEALIHKSINEKILYTVQEFVEIPQDEFPIVEDGIFKGFQKRNVNINFWSHDGEFAGAFNRAAKGSLVNVHQGGGLVPVFFVSKK